MASGASVTGRPPLQTFAGGARQALALHCTLAHGGAWRKLAAALSDVMTLHAIDFPGHGRASSWDQTIDFHSLCTAWAHDQLSQQMDVIGHSFGATVALRVAVERPELVRSLTLIEPVFFAAAIADAPARMAMHEAEVAPCFTALEQGDTQLAARLFNRHWGDGTAWDSIPRETQRYMADRMYTVPGQSAGIIEDTAGMLTPGALDRVAMPVLLIEGDESPGIISVIHDSLEARMPHLRRVQIAGAGHMAPITHPLAVAHEIRALLEVAEKQVDIRVTD